MLFFFFASMTSLQEYAVFLSTINKTSINKICAL